MRVRPQPVHPPLGWTRGSVRFTTDTPDNGLEEARRPTRRPSVMETRSVSRCVAIAAHGKRCQQSPFRGSPYCWHHTQSRKIWAPSRPLGTAAVRAAHRRPGRARREPTSGARASSGARAPTAGRVGRHARPRRSAWPRRSGRSASRSCSTSWRAARDGAYLLVKDAGGLVSEQQRRPSAPRRSAGAPEEPRPLVAPRAGGDRPARARGHARRAAGGLRRRRAWPRTPTRTARCRSAEGQTISQPLVVALMAAGAGAGPRRPRARGRRRQRLRGRGARAAWSRASTPSRCARRWRAGPPPTSRPPASPTCAVHDADGTAGWPEGAPYDAISVAAGGPRVPAALREQLAPGGRLVMPVGRRPERQRLVRVRRGPEGEERVEDLGIPVRFVPLVSEDERRR